MRSDRSLQFFFVAKRESTESCQMLILIVTLSLAGYDGKVAPVYHFKLS